jgi:diketogulonate reductase-like aldo/keto reductase
LRELIAQASVPPAVNQIEFNPFAYRRRLVEACKQEQVVVQAYSPLMQGHGIDDRRISAVAQKYGRSNAQVLLRWALQRDTVVLPKSAHQDRIQANAQLFDFNLDPDDLAALDGLDRTGGTDSAR